MSLAAMIGLYALYAKHLVPLIEGPQNIVRREIVAPNISTSSRFDKTELTQMLPEDAWEHGDVKTLLTSQGTILFKDFERIEGGFVEVLPFTLVANMGGDQTDLTTEDQLDPDADKSGNKKPLTVLRCPSGARLKLNKGFADVSPGKTKMESAELIGQVQISRPPSSPTAEDGMKIRTSDVKIDKHRIYTSKDVIFAIGLNRGRGTDLTIELAHDSSMNEITGDFSSVEGIQRISLAVLKQLRLESRSNNEMPNVRGFAFQPGSTSPAQNSSARNSQPFSKMDSPLNISCSGPFVFDFPSQTATFADQVSVVVENEYQDNIKCDHLSVTFDNVKKPSSEGTANSPASISTSKTSNQMNKLKLREFVATGSPAVVLSAQRKAKITGDLISYQANRQLLVVQSNDLARPVAIVSPDLHLVAGKIDYQIPADGSIGLINAKGPGKMLRPAGAKRKEFYVEWTDRLIVKPLPNSRQLVTLTGGTRARIDGDTNIKSDLLHFWLHQIQVNEILADGQLKQSWDYQPERIAAEQNVEIVSPKLEGKTNRLIASWPLIPANQSSSIMRTHLNQPASNDRNTRPSIDNRFASYQYQATLRTLRPTYQDSYQDSVYQPRIQDADSIQNLRSVGQNFAPMPVQSDSQTTTVRRRQPNQPIQSNQAIGRDEIVGRIRQPSNAENQSAGGQKSKTKKRLSFVGDSVAAKLVTNGDDTELQNVVINGNVTVKQLIDRQDSRIASNSQSNQSLNITGDSVQVTPINKEQFRLMVAGDGQRLAWVNTKNLQLRGEKIHMDQPANKLWVEGKGRVEIKNKLQPMKASATAKTNYQDVTANWKGGMIFDGAQIYFEHDVEMTALGLSKDNQPIVTKSSSEGLSLKLSQAINFRDLDGDQELDDIDITKMEIVDRVIEAQRVFPLANPPAANLSAGRIAPSSMSNQTFDRAGSLVESQKFLVAQATLDADSGSINSAGPGVLIQYKKGSSKLLVDQNDRRTEKTKPNPDGLNFVRVNFDGSLNANVEKKEITIRGNVRTIYSPVQSTSESYDPDQLSRQLPPDSIRIKCEQLKMVQWTPRNSSKASKEMLATGNAHIISSKFEATADRVSYSEANDSLVIEGTARSAAQLWSRPPAGSVKHLVAEKILYRVSDQSYDVQGVKSGGMSQ